MNRDEILLKEYEVIQQDINSRRPLYWIMLGVLIPVITTLLGAVVYMVLSDITHAEWFALGVGLGMIVILIQLKRYHHRLTYTERIKYLRMRKIERQLRMWNNLIVQHFDELYKKSDKQARKRLTKSRIIKYMPEKAPQFVTIIFYVLIGFWVSCIIIAFISA